MGGDRLDAVVQSTLDRLGGITGVDDGPQGLCVHGPAGSGHQDPGRMTGGNTSARQVDHPLGGVLTSRTSVTAAGRAGTAAGGPEQPATG